MKKYLLLALATICISGIIPVKVHATDISIGATTWYAWYKESGIKADPGFLYGPALSVKMDDYYNVTFVYLYGKFDVTDAGTKTNMKRQDADLALNYRLHNYFKVYGGIKYMNLKTPDSDLDYTALGPGLGLSVTYPIENNIFLLATLSGFYLWGEGDPARNKANFIEYGINSTLAIAYYIVPAATVISLGGRYQYSQDKNDSNYKRTFFGATLTATYSFSI